MGSVGFFSLVRELALTWKRLRLISRDEAGCSTQTVIVVALLVVLALVASVFL